MTNSNSKSPKKNNTDEINDELKIENENLRFLLEHKISYLNTVSNVCMSWWVSSIVFCASILAGTWLKGSELVESKIIIYLGIVVICFFASFIYFGTGIIGYLNKLDNEISELIKKLKPTASMEILADTFKTEISAIKRGVEIGRGTFTFILIVWIILFIALHQGCWKIPEKVNKPNNQSLENPR